MAYKAYVYRLYPNQTQKDLLSRFFGCVRFVYNRCLDEQERLYKVGEKYASRTVMNNYCNRVLKGKYPFLREVDKFALTNAVFNLDNGYQRMFRKEGKHPKYKSRKKSQMSYTTNMTNQNIKVLEKGVQLPKLGIVRAVIHRPLPGGSVIKSATVKMERDGSYYVSVLVEYEAITKSSTGDKAVGLDYKSDCLFMPSEDDPPELNHVYRSAQKKLRKEQRKLRKKVKESANWRRQQSRIARLYRHIANSRKDQLHKLSTEIANRYDVVCVEDLNMRSMANKGFGNGKATLDNGYGMFLNMLNYKLEERGKTIVKVDRWYPSSQICSKCGNQRKISLNTRTYSCPVCGTMLDRDRNAAINILREGLKRI